MDTQAPALSNGRLMGFSELPEELIREIIRYYPSIDDTAYNPEELEAPRGTKPSKRRQRRAATSNVHTGDARCQPVAYLDRTDTLRALRATCTAYRAIFQPLLWESVNVCFPSRKAGTERGNGAHAEPAYRTIGEALYRKSQGLLANPGLAVIVRYVYATRWGLIELSPLFSFLSIPSSS